ncbi:hypothetical protein [Paenibacillus segetis]|uniref:Uncharacterized protein n=1 Tax=Paenibacillus segetis TaxID=1325360 RepID=A0ABQ1YA32_9BACL|nr:hypothetical protein [Paenibacillus segetis]GGH17023.1 hypothetical protein GCM10008013_12200 [Paenibacillus segetis]
MGTAYSVDVSSENIEVEVLPETKYCSTALCLRGGFGTIQLFAANEHLAEIEFALRNHLDRIRYPETPDQQLIMNEEMNHYIKEEIA